VSDLSKRVETDVSVFRLRLAPIADGTVVFGWDYPGSTLLRVRILRADSAADGAAAGVPDAAAANAAKPDAAAASAAAPESQPGAARPEPEPDANGPWRLVYDSDTGSFRDRDLQSGRAYRYAVFARNGDGPWTLWRDEVVTLP
jgi:hypothetical protein